ncbi:MAG TPA: hypothetical protein VL966_19945 [Alphaproteobacteria bacterium]|jgi:hypothetical protein|nr:hypothetical protein [Alphaproteobacteria bacterium]
MRRILRQLAFIAFTPLLFIASAWAQHAVVPDRPDSGTDGNPANAVTAVGLASAFLATYSPVAGNAIRDTGSWKAVSVGQTWEVHVPSTGPSGDTFVITVGKTDGNIVSVVEQP